MAVDKAQIEYSAEIAAKELNVALQRVENFKMYLDGVQDADLTTMGFTAPEIANLRSAFADLGEFYTLYLGDATLVAAKDFRTFARRVWGLGYNPNL